MDQTDHNGNLRGDSSRAPADVPRLARLYSFRRLYARALKTAAKRRGLSAGMVVKVGVATFTSETLLLSLHRTLTASSFQVTMYGWYI